MVDVAAEDAGVRARNLRQHKARSVRILRIRYPVGELQRVVKRGSKSELLKVLQISSRAGRNIPGSGHEISS